jgi:uncharacterized membrane protein YeaQ/YmgE (transglycosylase-associated protein family)
MIVITAAAGAVAGWLTGVLMRRGGYKLVMDTALGVVGGVAGALVLWMQWITPDDNQLAMMCGAAFAGGFIVVAARRMFWNAEAAATQ